MTPLSTNSGEEIAALVAAATERKSSLSTLFHLTPKSSAGLTDVWSLRLMGKKWPWFPP